MFASVAAAAALARRASPRLLGGGGALSTSKDGGFAPSLSAGVATLSSGRSVGDDGEESTNSTMTSSLSPLAPSPTSPASSFSRPSAGASAAAYSCSSSMASLSPSAAAAASPRAFSASASSYGTDDDSGGDPSSAFTRAACPTTPWVRSVVSGVDLMRNPKYNKGLAFSEDERDRLYLRGLLPPAVLPMRTQAARAMVNVLSKAADLDKLTYLSSLQERNQSLFHRALADHVEELLPVWGEPTLSSACAAHGLMFRSLPRALFIGLRDRGRVAQILKNWPERRVKVLCVTDGERVGGGGAWATEGGGGGASSSLSSPPSSSSSSPSSRSLTGIDLGVQAVGVPVARLALYAAVGGVDPSVCLPIAIDAGTDNADLLSSPFYVGSRRPRARGDEYEALLDELLSAARARFGPSLFVDFENMRFRTLRAAFGAYRGAFPCYSDDVQGTAAVAVAALLSACRATGRSLRDQIFLFVGGDSPAGSHVAEMVAEAISRGLGEVDGGGGSGGGSSRSSTSSSLSSSSSPSPSSILDATSKIWMADSKGLVTRSRADLDTLPDHVLPYCRDIFADSGKEGGGGSMTHVAVGPGLLAAVRAVKPTVLIGGPASGGARFSREVLAELSSYGGGGGSVPRSRPIVLALSNDSAGGRGEVSAADAYEWTGGAALFADRSRPGSSEAAASGTVMLSDGSKRSPSRLHTAYLYPGLGHGAVASRSTRLRDEAVLAAAEAISAEVTDAELSAGALLPPLSSLRAVAARVACAAARRHYDLGVATELPRPPDLGACLRRAAYEPSYRKYR